MFYIDINRFNNYWVLYLQHINSAMKMDKIQISQILSEQYIISLQLHCLDSVHFYLKLNNPKKIKNTMYTYSAVDVVGPQQ